MYEPVPQAVAFTASAIIAPGFAPLAKLPLTLVGAGLVAGEPTLARAGLARFGLDWQFVLVASLVVFGLKQAWVHRRQPIM